LGAFKTRAIAAAALLAMSVAAATAYHEWSKAAPEWNSYRSLPAQPSSADQATRAAFLSPGRSRQQRYDDLFRYFLEGAVSHASSSGGLEHYRGLPGRNGYRVSGLEGFARTAPLFAAWVASGRPRQVAPTTGAAPVDLVEWLRRGLVAGSDPRSVDYWGNMSSGDQRIVEAADIARVIWIARDTVWPRLSAVQQSNLVHWLRQSETARINGRNNWILFPVVVDAVLERLGQPHGNYRDNYQEFKRNYLENGWFRDGPDGEVDYYNSWGIGYDLFWIDQLLPALDSDFQNLVLNENGDLTRHLISPRGVPIMGRSVCYRAGIPASVIAASQLPASSVTQEQAAGALDAVWSYFVDHGVLRDGTMTMGYFDTDPRVVDDYSGPGSCHWGLRSLTVAYLYPAESPFWRNIPARLPVEEGDYRMNMPRLGWRVEGRQATGDITITLTQGSGRPARIALESYGIFARWKAALLHRPFRPGNYAAKYGAASYSVLHPFVN
jgi:hypothetical protein